MSRRTAQADKPCVSPISCPSVSPYPLSASPLADRDKWSQWPCQCWSDPRPRRVTQLAHRGWVTMRRSQGGAPRLTEAPGWLSHLITWRKTQTNQIQSPDKQHVPHLAEEEIRANGFNLQTPWRWGWELSWTLEGCWSGPGCPVLPGLCQWLAEPELPVQDSTAEDNKRLINLKTNPALW